jgi:tripartite-type tricarboxylate transporter receptor subunit TctC
MLATFGQERDDQFPDVPTPYELGYKDVIITGWSGLLAPAGTPPAVVNKIYAAMATILATPEIKEAISKLGTRPQVSKSPEDFARHIKAESEKYYPVIKAAGLEGSQ